MKRSPEQLNQRYNKLKARRGNWETLWQELTELLIPRKDDIIITRSPGERRNLRVFDNTGMQALQTLAGALQGLLTNPSSLWFFLTTGDENLDKEDAVKEWLQDSTRVIINILNNSNFHTEVYENYIDLASIGTSSNLILEDDEFVVRFKAEHISEIHIDENSKGLVDEVIRRFKWTPRKLIGEFGSKSLHPDVLKAFEDDSEIEFDVQHSVYPFRVDKDEKAKVGQKPFISQYHLPQFNHEIIEEGFEEFPYVVSRWAKSTGEIYGRSPGMNALPDLKTLQEMTRVTIQGAQKTVDPAIQLPDDGFVLPIMTAPGSINYYRSGSADRIEPIFNDARIDFGFEAMREKRNRVREAFFTDQLQLGVGGPQMTATEVAQRTEERMTLLAPFLSRQNFEFLRPMINRVFNIADRKGLIPEAPDAVVDRKIDVRYSSLIAQAQRARELNNMLRTIEAVTPVIQMQPEAADIIEGDNFVREAAALLNFPASAIRSNKQLEELRAARQQAQAEQQKADEDAATAQQAAQIGQAVNQGAQAGAVGQG